MSVERKAAFLHRGKKERLIQRRKVAKTTFKKDVISEQLKNNLIRMLKKTGVTTDLSGRYIVSIERKDLKSRYESRELRTPFLGLSTIKNPSFSEKSAVVSGISESLKIPEDVLYDKLFSRSHRSFEWEGEILEGLTECMQKAELMALEAQLPKDFNYLEWLGRWFVAPQPALNGRAPIETMRTSHEIDQVKNLLDAMRYGVYL